MAVFIPVGEDTGSSSMIRIDDFGTGCSSLAYLKNVPIEVDVVV